MIAADLNSSEIDSQLGLYTTMLVLRYSLGETDPCKHSTVIMSGAKNVIAKK